MYLKNLSNIVKVRLSNVMLNKLGLLATIRNKSISEVIRDILLQYLALERVEDEHKETDKHN